MTTYIERLRESIIPRATTNSLGLASLWVCARGTVSMTFNAIRRIGRSIVISKYLLSLKDQCVSEVFKL